MIVCIVVLTRHIRACDIATYINSILSRLSSYSNKLTQSVTVYVRIDGISTTLHWCWERWNENRQLNAHVSIFLLTFNTLFQFFNLRARPPKYISKLIITFIWIISILFSIPMALALRVIQIPFRKCCLNTKIVIQ